MNKYVVLAAAEAEFNEAVDWYYDQSERAAARLVAEVEQAIDAICRNPEMYPRLDDTYRFYLLNRFPYYVAYRVANKYVAIVAIRHTSQDQDAWRGR